MLAEDDRYLHDLVRKRLPTLVDLAEDRGGFVPSHVVRALDRFARCGDPTLGFALLRCDCGNAKVVPFRCHGRALCPTCGGRAMASGAAHLVDRVLPDVTVRQWGLSVPWPRRYLFARRPELCAGVRRRVWRELSRWYRRRAKELGFEDGCTGAVVVVQRFGSKLNLNVHFHMLLLDGVYVADEHTGALRWVKLPAPTTDEVQQLVARIATVVERWLETQGYGAGRPRTSTATSGLADAQALHCGQQDGARCTRRCSDEPHLTTRLSSCTTSAGTPMTTSSRQPDHLRLLPWQGTSGREH